jgi:hypothetical protein
VRRLSSQAQPGAAIGKPRVDISTMTPAARLRGSLRVVHYALQSVRQLLLHDGRHFRAIELAALRCTVSLVRSQPCCAVARTLPCSG